MSVAHAAGLRLPVVRLAVAVDEAQHDECRGDAEAPEQQRAIARAPPRARTTPRRRSRAASRRSTAAADTGTGSGTARRPSTWARAAPPTAAGWCRAMPGAHRPMAVERVVAEHDERAEREARVAAEELQRRQQHHAGADDPDDLHERQRLAAELLDAARREAGRRGDDEDLDEDQPQAAREQEPAQGRPASCAPP